MEKVSPEKKMELIKTIREESERNKGRVQTREHILFGTPEPLPLYSKDPSYANPNVTTTPTSFLGLKLRFLLAVLLFVCFLLLDLGKISWNNVTSIQIQTEINKMSTASNLIDFITNFPYTLKEEVRVLDSKENTP